MAVFFSYGHAFNALSDRVSHSVLLPVALTTALILGYVTLKRRGWARGAGRFANYASVPLMALPLVSVGQFLGATLRLDQP